MHTPEEVSHRLLFANSMGCFLTILTGASFMPWIWAMIRWAVSHLPFLHLRPFPSLLSALLHPNWTLGIIWLGYYLLSYGWASLAPSPAVQVVDQKSLYSHDLARQSQEQMLGTSLYQTMKKHTKKEALNARRSQPLLSQAWPGEEKHDLIEQCYQQYREALLRYHPAPLELTIPEAKTLAKLPNTQWAEAVRMMSAGEVKTAKAAVLEIKKATIEAQAHVALSKPRIALASWETWLAEQSPCDLLIRQEFIWQGTQSLIVINRIMLCRPVQ